VSDSNQSTATASIKTVGIATAKRMVSSGWHLFVPSRRCDYMLTKPARIHGLNAIRVRRVSADTALELIRSGFVTKLTDEEIGGSVVSLYERSGVH